MRRTNACCSRKDELNTQVHLGDSGARYGRLQTGSRRWRVQGRWHRVSRAQQMLCNAGACLPAGGALLTLSGTYLAFQGNLVPRTALAHAHTASIFAYQSTWCMPQQASVASSRGLLSTPCTGSLATSERADDVCQLLPQVQAHIAQCPRCAVDK